MKRKRKLVIIVSLATIILIIICSVLLNKSEQVQTFNIKTYEQEVEEFSSQKIFGYARYVGSIKSSNMAKICTGNLVVDRSNRHSDNGRNGIL